MWLLCQETWPCSATVHQRQVLESTQYFDGSVDCICFLRICVTFYTYPVGNIPSGQCLKGHRCPDVNQVAEHSAVFFASPTCLLSEPDRVKSAMRLSPSRTTEIKALPLSSGGIRSPLVLVPGTVCRWHSFHLLWGFHLQEGCTSRFWHCVFGIVSSSSLWRYLCISTFDLCIRCLLT